LEEGPSYLFRGGFPIAVAHYLFYGFFCTEYIFLKNKFFYLHLYNDYDYNLTKIGFMGFSFFTAFLAAYPALFAREMIDIWPKERGGHCTWNGNYRQCFKWVLIFILFSR
jgi:hypothetical protein